MSSVGSAGTRLNHLMPLCRSIVVVGTNWVDLRPKAGCQLLEQVQPSLQMGDSEADYKQGLSHIHTHCSARHEYPIPAPFRD